MSMVAFIKRVPENVSVGEIKAALAPVQLTSVKILSDYNAEIGFQAKDFVSLVQAFPTLKLVVLGQELRLELPKDSSKTVVLNRIPAFVSQDELQIYTNEYLIHHKYQPSFVNIFMSKSRTQSANCIFPSENDAKLGLSLLFPVDFSNFLMSRIGRNYLNIIETAEADARNGKVSDNEVFQLVARGYDQKIVESNQVQVPTKKDTYIDHNVQQHSYQKQKINIAGAVQLNNVIQNVQQKQQQVEKKQIPQQASLNSVVLTNLAKITSINEIFETFSIFGEIREITPRYNGFVVFFKNVVSVQKLVQNDVKIVIQGCVVKIQNHVIQSET
ncbi:hypothetical protein SS50377_27295 [Spironucleus salmonicida]|uniref:RRM domain-containing protein n=1 Tax=Spironucleus salmonicida TaxID=348837 RepID=V6LQK6_9EUKA|nr:hypothetical protein SS50377_28827 [Spironucleus salmonicida]KAH0571001.1 hypothetical protein SS50377_27295 [Spironucleus salmonicida]|eukprot:EST46957.1 Hypothetical protein SS50377_12992 [Spironucleus salmonicida]